MTNFYFYLTEGTRIFLAGWKARISPKKFDGDAKEICNKIVKDCWNGKYFQTSSQNFNQFWTRDFGWCTKSLIELGYKREVHKTIRYALNCFQKKKQVTTTISPKDKPFDFPYYAVDSLPWLIHSIKLSKFDYNNYLSFLNKEINRFYTLVVDTDSKLVMRDKHFSSMKDFSVRNSSCYDNCMLIMLINDIIEINKKNPAMKLSNPFFHLRNKDEVNIKKTKQYYSNLFKNNFWNKEEGFFYDDLDKKSYVAGDANVFPLILGIVNDDEIITRIIKKISDEKLDQPLPLRYSNGNYKIKFIPQEFFLNNYEFNTAWTHMGPLWTKFVKKHDLKLYELYLDEYQKMIEKNNGFLEVIKPNGKPFWTLFYYCDKTMLWAANYLTL